MTENKDPMLPAYSPDKLLAIFTKTRFIFYLGIALAVHVIIIAATSIGYINDNWIDPKGAARRLEELAAAAKTNQAAFAATNKPAGSAGTGTVAATAASGPAGTNISADRTNSLMMKQITAAAKPEEIPSITNALGISLEDTNPQ
jgi:hypothetical protein